jgi:hypothetical protein
MEHFTKHNQQQEETERQTTDKDTNKQNKDKQKQTKGQRQTTPHNRSENNVNDNNIQKEKDKEIIKGGDVASCFSSVDLDFFFSHFASDFKHLNINVVSSRLFFDLRNNLITTETFLKEINMKDFRFVFVPLHISFHWLLSIFFKVKNDVYIFIFDSCPNENNLNMIKRIFKKKLNNDNITFIKSCKQFRYSNECGLFVIFFLLSFLLGFDLSLLENKTISLNALRKFVLDKDKSKIISFIQSCFVIGGDVFILQDQREEIKYARTEGNMLSQQIFDIVTKKLLESSPSHPYFFNVNFFSCSTLVPSSPLPSFLLNLFFILLIFLFSLKLKQN